MPLSREERFWQRVERQPDDGCWLFTGHRGAWGYAFVLVGKKRVHAHRYAYELAIGPIPEGMMVKHTCNVAHCVKPAHLYLSTVAHRPPSLGPLPRGAGPSHHFTEDQVREIRHLFADAGWSIGDLAAKYGFTKLAIRRAVDGDTHRRA